MPVKLLLLSSRWNFVFESAETASDHIFSPNTNMKSGYLLAIALRDLWNAWMAAKCRDAAAMQLHAHYRRCYDIRATASSIYMYLEVITRMFSYRHLYQARASITARDEVEGCCGPRAWYGCRYENSRVITSLSYDRSCLNRWAKIILKYIMLKVILLNSRTIDRLLRCLHIGDAVARCLQQPIRDVRRWRMRCGL